VRAIGRLLDAPCGIGRHALAFASRGWDVVGLDLGPAFVERARATAKAMGLGNASFSVGDLREVGRVLADSRGSFDVILNLFTSIGYWTLEEDLSTLAQFHDLASSSGLLIVDTINRDYVVKHFDPLTRETYGDIVYFESRTFDYGSSRVESKWAFYEKEGEDLHHRATIPVSTRAYAPHELRDSVLRAGWSKCEVYSGWTLAPPTPDQYRLMAVARR
jgi:SAM-dependent methyltransferase